MIKNKFLPDSEFYQWLIISQIFQFGILIFASINELTAYFFFCSTALTLFKKEKHTYLHVDYFYWLFFFTYANCHTL